VSKFRGGLITENLFSAFFFYFIAVYYSASEIVKAFFS